MFASSYAITTSNFANATGYSNSVQDSAVLKDGNRNFSTDAQGDVFIKDGGYSVAAMYFPLGSVMTN
jgi:hypothetical protein